MARHSFRDEIEGKACTKCGKWKPLDGFYIDRATLDELSSRCRQCIRQTQKIKHGLCPSCGTAICSVSTLCRSCSQIKRRRREQGYAIVEGIAGQNCSRCGDWKPLTEFYIKASLPSGVGRICKECCREQARRYGMENRKKRQEYRRKWNAKNKDKVRSYIRKALNKRRARLASVIVRPIDERVVYERCHHCCVYCGRVDDLTLDHVIPIAKGGPHTEDNLVIACKKCNCKKGAKWLGVGDDHWLPWEWHGSFPYGEIRQRVAVP